MEAGKRNITGIFNRANTLRIPHFQRAYVWEEDHWERFLDDMRYASHPGRPYFMGSIILKQQEVAVDQKNIRTIIDGQQRLTTFILFFKALYDINSVPKKFEEIFTTFTGDLILEHNYTDKPVFDKIVHGQTLTASEQQGKIAKCYAYFLKNLTDGTIDANNLLSNILFVGIDLQYQEDEQQIFDTINSLGVRLTTAELLKNYLFKNDVAAYNEKWRDVFEKDDEIRVYWDQDVTSGRTIRSNIDLFLQSYLFIKIQDPTLAVSSDDKERFFKIDSVFTSYKEFITDYGIDKNVVIDELKEYAAVYKKTINPSITEEQIDRDDAVARLNLVIFGLETATIIPYVLFIAKNVSNQSEQSAILKYLESYLMRRLVCRQTGKNYNQLFRSFINNGIDSVEKLKGIIEKKGDKINRMPSDNNVRRAFHESQLTNNQAKGVLYLIEEIIRSPLNATELKEFDEYSLEHIMPKKWRNNWRADGLTKEQEDLRDDIILTIGNLTFIPQTLNATVRDSAWDIKKKGKGQYKGLLAYAQGIEIFQKYLQLERWDEEGIGRRAEELGSYAVEKVWNVGLTVDEDALDEDKIERINEADDLAEVRKDLETRSSGKLWNWDMFRAKLKKEFGEDEVNVTEKIINWAKEKNIEIEWSTSQRGGFFLVFYDRNDKWFCPFNINGDARIGWNIAHSRDKSPAPFNKIEKRTEMLKRLGKINGVTVDPDNVNGFSGLKFPLRALVNEDALAEFFSTCLWIKKSIEE
jgi:uncharacterized protein with ParB-like and HNH nuclease domain